MVPRRQGRHCAPHQGKGPASTRRLSTFGSSLQLVGTGFFPERRFTALDQAAPTRPAPKTATYSPAHRQLAFSPSGRKPVMAILPSHLRGERQKVGDDTIPSFAPAGARSRAAVDCNGFLGHEPLLARFKRTPGRAKRAACSTCPAYRTPKNGRH